MDRAFRKAGEFREQSDTGGIRTRERPTGNTDSDTTRSLTHTSIRRRSECFGASMTGKMVTRHVWQDAPDSVAAFTKTAKGRRIYTWRKETIERYFAEAKQNHGLRYARMPGIRNMREQCFLTVTVQNIKRLAAGVHFLRYIKPATLCG